MRRHLGREVDRGRAVRTADDADGACLLCVEAEKHRTEQGDEYTDLCRCAHEERGRTCNQRTEVRHRADPEKDERREDLVFDTQTDCGHDAWLLKAVERNVRKDTAECDRTEEQRLEVACKREVEQNETDNNHDEVAAGQTDETAAINDRLNGYSKCIKEIHTLSLPPQRAVRMPAARP